MWACEESSILSRRVGNQNTNFWLALLNISTEPPERIHLWNGYLCWRLPLKIREEVSSNEKSPQFFIHPPEGGWPELSQDEKEIIETLAEEHGGHPSFESFFEKFLAYQCTPSIQSPLAVSRQWYMDFSGLDHSEFPTDKKMSGLIFVHSNFQGVNFRNPDVFFDDSCFYGETNFDGVSFSGQAFFEETYFDALVSFDHSRFGGDAFFEGSEFVGGASFRDAQFICDAIFKKSEFKETHYRNSGVSLSPLADFREVKFNANVSFHGTRFGGDVGDRSGTSVPERVVDFSNAEFKWTTDFHNSIFKGVPAFFNTTLHEDTDFSNVNWEEAETNRVSPSYAIRAWERLELIMSRLEKPHDRHQFFRLKMRARRRVDTFLLRFLNWLFEEISDYGWGVKKACKWWFGHWIVFAGVLLVNTYPAKTSAGWGDIVWAALGTSFANAHIFLFLTAEDGYLACERKLLKDNDVLGLFTPVGVVESVLGPIFLFFLLLTLRNRFRLA